MQFVSHAQSSSMVSFLIVLISSGVRVIFIFFFRELLRFPDYLVFVLGAQGPSILSVSHLRDRRLAALHAVLEPAAWLPSAHLVTDTSFSRISRHWQRGMLPQQSGFGTAISSASSGGAASTRAASSSMREIAFLYAPISAPARPKPSPPRRALRRSRSLSTIALSSASRLRISVCWPQQGIVG